jgi:O-antigen ligase
MLAVSVAVLLVSLRRNIWLATIGAIILVFAFSRRRATYAIRVTAAAVAAIVAVQLFFPAVTSAVIDRFVAADLLRGFDSRDTSTAGHFQDIAVGWDLALAKPWLGYGPDNGLPGLVVQKGLYVHNDALMAWLGFGMVGLVSYLLTMLIGILLALRVLNRKASIMNATAAFFLIITPLAGTSAGFVMATYRWPLLYGICLGISVAAISKDARLGRTQARNGDPDATSHHRQSGADRQFTGR